MKVETGQYYSVERRKEVADSARKLRRQFLRYKEAEIVYSIQHKKLLELAGKAGALVRVDGYVLIDRDVFEEYLEQFREPSTLIPASNELSGCVSIHLANAARVNNPALAAGLLTAKQGE